MHMSENKRTCCVLLCLCIKLTLPCAALIIPAKGHMRIYMARLIVDMVFVCIIITFIIIEVEGLCTSDIDIHNINIMSFSNWPNYIYMSTLSSFCNPCLAACFFIFFLGETCSNNKVMIVIYAAHHHTFFLIK